MIKPGPQPVRMAISLGPVLFHWPGGRLEDFYARIADEAPVDRVFIGEVVCSKRLPRVAESLARAVARLQRGGKEVILSTLALFTRDGERRSLSGLIDETSLALEVNDISALDAVRGRAFTIGPFVNVYNESTLAFLAQSGARRFCLPPELPLRSIAILARAAAMRGLGAEVIGFGRLPLALSGRCYHARLHGTRKDACQFVCETDPDGRAVTTLDGTPFLAVNGVMTMSHGAMSAIEDLPAIAAAGVDSIRLSPQSCDMAGVATTFRAVLDGAREAEWGRRRLEDLLPFARFANGFLHGAPGIAHIRVGAGETPA